MSRSQTSLNLILPSNKVYHINIGPITYLLIDFNNEGYDYGEHGINNFFVG